MMLILQIPRLHNEYFFSFYWLKLLQIVTIFLYSNIKFNLWENKKGSSCKKYCIKLKSIVIWTLIQWYVIYIIWKTLEKHFGIIHTNLDSYKNRIFSLNILLHNLHTWLNFQQNCTYSNDDKTNSSKTHWSPSMRGNEKPPNLIQARKYQPISPCKTSWNRWWVSDDESLVNDPLHVCIRYLQSHVLKNGCFNFLSFCEFL